MAQKRAGSRYLSTKIYRRKRLYILKIVSIESSISDSVENLEAPNRSAAVISSFGRPMAVNTWLGGLLPLLHAEPRLQAIPARSRAISSA